MGADIEEDLPLLEAKIKMLKNEYDQYFLGTRPREPVILRGEVQKLVAIWAQQPIPHTRHRFRFNNLRARYFAFRRHWDDVLRRIEQGTYERHVFKAKLHEREGQPGGGAKRPGADTGGLHGAGDDDLYDAYTSARAACGQANEGLSPDKLKSLLAKQEAQIRERYACSKVDFKVVVEEGKAKLKAVPS